MSISLAPNATAANVRIELLDATADQIEELIHELAQLRQEMSPEVVRYGPKRLLLIDQPDIKMKISQDGRISFAVRSAGLGWLDIPFTRENSAATIVACVGAASEMKDRPNVFSAPEGNA